MRVIGMWVRVRDYVWVYIFESESESDCMRVLVYLNMFVSMWLHDWDCYKIIVCGCIWVCEYECVYGCVTMNEWWGSEWVCVCLSECLWVCVSEWVDVKVSVGVWVWLIIWVRVNEYVNLC